MSRLTMSFRDTDPIVLQAGNRRQCSENCRSAIKSVDFARVRAPGKGTARSKNAIRGPIEAPQVVVPLHLRHTRSSKYSGRKKAETVPA